MVNFIEFGILMNNSIALIFEDKMEEDAGSNLITILTLHSRSEKI